jgi:hypothetical protein
MNAQPTTAFESDPNPADPGAGADPAARRARHLEILDRFAEIGMTIGEAIGRQVLEGPPPAEAAAEIPVRFHNDIAQAFERTSRAVRMTIGLYDKMTAPPRGKAAGSPAQAEAEEDEWCLEDMLEELDRKNAMLARLQVEVGAAARAAGHDEQAVERLVREGREGLGNADDMVDLMKRRSSDQIIAMVCHDLGLGDPARVHVSPPPEPQTPPETPPESEEQAAIRAGQARAAENLRFAEFGPPGWESGENWDIDERTGKRHNGWP